MPLPVPLPVPIASQPGPDPLAERRYNQQMNSFAFVHNVVTMHTVIKELHPTSKVLHKQRPRLCAGQDEAITQHKSFNCCRSGDFPGGSHLLTA